MPRWVDTKNWDGGLSQRQWDSVVRQAKAMLDSWIELRENDFRGIVYHSSLDDDLKQALYRINLRHAWWERVDDEAHRMARRIIKHLHKRNRFPNPMRCRTMSMDGKIAQIQPSNGGEYYYWARISTLEKGHPLYAPILIHSDLEPHLNPDDPQRLANHLQLRVNEDDTIVARLMTTMESVKPRDTGEAIGLDWGLKSLFATSDGRLYGLELFAWLQKRDMELTALTRELAHSHVSYKQSKRYRNLNRRIREYVRNETNRVLNLIADDRLREIVVEDLDFRHGGLSKQMNRILTRAGRATVRYKLQRLSQTKGIAITHVNPAYTSLECGSCGWASSKNRPNRNLFRCECCGYTLNADIAAARTIRARRSRPESWRRIGRTIILSQLRKEHAQRCPDGKRCPSRRKEYGSPTSAKAKANTETRVKNKRQS
ncbi:zinc ribbon domain-containing protein [Bifidobacterium amazonense]|uniref:Zinc ribbon domain-containing protein n=1 Tax=Bifidobacterium amazonense TaxID=2809027 RepID=A0ABS9VVB9_9BIFI|nr:zinc ribbon domain-containing protein [Bifidobacterium amazonense]MCH9275765.1 zinc ribbon domain-containing protein [Bifidobacterium amazonense]